MKASSEDTIFLIPLFANFFFFKTLRETDFEVYNLHNYSSAELRNLSPSLCNCTTAASVAPQLVLIKQLTFVERMCKCMLITTVTTDYPAFLETGEQDSPYSREIQFPCFTIKYNIVTVLFLDKPASQIR